MKPVAVLPFRYTWVGLRPFIPYALIYLLLLLPAICVVFFRDLQAPPDYLLMRLVASIAVFTIPVVFFYRNIKLYFYLLALWVVLSPVLIFFVAWLRVPLNFSLVALLMQTNAHELAEASKGYRILFAVSTLSYLVIYLLAVRNTATRRLSFNTAVAASLGAALFLLAFTLVKQKHYRYLLSDVLEETYPVSLFSGLYTARSFVQKNNLNASKNFHFHAHRKDKVPGRRVFVFIIGESSRYDHWAINGYARPTTPLLSQRKDLTTFSDVTSGCNLTWMSVPQMITRAEPDQIDVQFKEKSILAAYKDAGFKTVWLSNQGDKEIFWSGSITLHAKTADVSKFDFPQKKGDSVYNEYDERLLPPLDSLLRADSSDLFIVLHTMGNHWTYPDRYPQAFDVFQPAGRSDAMNPFSANGKELITNSYDNSIRYADFIVDSVIRMVEKYNAVSAVTFLSDHGEDLFDSRSGKMNFHLAPSVSTLHVPMFIWTSEKYRQTFGDKVYELRAHRNDRIGPENTFYTLLDLSNITFHGFDTTKSVAHVSFRQSDQKFYEDHAGKSFYYSQLVSRE